MVFVLRAKYRYHEMHREEENMGTNRKAEPDVLLSANSGLPDLMIQASVAFVERVESVEAALVESAGSKSAPEHLSGYRLSV